MKAEAEPDYYIHTSKSVRDFLDYLLSSSEHWRSAKLGDLAYRGQAGSGWRLVPKAFRIGQWISRGSEAPSPCVTSQARAEFRAVHEFVKAADSSGLDITEAGARLLMQEDPSHIFSDSDWEHKWPQDEILEVLALGQHHGVPTRLLDFTEDPLVAAYFAASFAWNPEKRQRLKGRERKYLAVWVVDLRFVRALNSIDGRYPERIGEVRVPRANNPYLNAQSGFFLIDRGANDVMRRGEILSIDQAILDRAGFWNNGKRLAGKGITRTWFDEFPVKQIRLPTALTAELLKELENRGITKGSVMPSLDRVVESLEFQRSLE